MHNNIPDILLKPTGTIQLSNPFSLGERKLLNVMMSKAQTSYGLSADEQDLPIEDVFKGIGWESSKNEDEIKIYIRGLLSKVIEWNEFSADKKNKWIACQFLSSAEIYNRRIRYLINPKIVEELKRPTLYAKIHLLVQGKLRKNHSLVFYEYFQDALGRSIALKNVTLEYVHKLLNTQDNESYQQFKYFKRDVLTPSINDLNKHSDLTVSFKAVKKGNKVVALDFFVKRDETFQMSFEFKEDISQTTSPDLCKQLVHYGLSQNMAETLCSRYSDNRIQGNISYFESEISKGKLIKNKAAWLRTAIEKDYRPIKSKADKEAEGEHIKLQEAAKIAAQEKYKKSKDDENKRIFQNHQLERAKEKFSTKPLEYQNKKVDIFLKELKSGNEEIYINSYKKSGFEDYFLAIRFFSPLYNELLDNLEDTDFESFKRSIIDKAA